MESIFSDIRAEIESINAEQIRSKIESLVDALDVLRQDGAITNDAYLDAGAIHGGLMMLSFFFWSGVLVTWSRMGSMGLRCAMHCVSFQERICRFFFLFFHLK